MKRNRRGRLAVGCPLIGLMLFLPACSVRKQQEKTANPDRPMEMGRRDHGPYRMVRMAPPDRQALARQGERECV